jgi:hypothetical protein
MQPKKANNMSVISVLKHIGSDAAKVLVWLGSPKGQATILAGESIVEAVYPAATGLIYLANSGLSEIIKLEALGAAAGSAPGTSVQKGAAAVAALTPQVLAYAEANGYSKPSGDQVQQMINLLVAFGNVLTKPATAAPVVA